MKSFVNLLKKIKQRALITSTADGMPDPEINTASEEDLIKNIDLHNVKIFEFIEKMI